MYNIIGDSGVKFCKTFKVINNFHHLFNGNKITSVCACMSDRERITHTNNSYSDTYSYTCVNANAAWESETWDM